MKKLDTRWQDAAGKDFVDRLISMGRSGNGYTISESPFGDTEEGILDLRGLRLSEKTRLRRVTFSPADFGSATWKGIWLERCSFSKTKFCEVSFQTVAEHGNEFIDCTFFKSSFREAAIGYKGSRFQSCSFESVIFTRAVFVRPEFDGCAFYRCKFDGCDLNGSSFERCRFVGTLRDVWFRGDFAHPNDVSRYGQPRKNRMAEVSFESACLRDVTFSNDCELKTVKLPADGHHKLITQWPSKLRNLQEQAEKWPGTIGKAATVFAVMHLVHAITQDCYILNRDDLEAQFGNEATDLIWRAIAAPADN